MLKHYSHNFKNYTQNILSQAKANLNTDIRTGHIYTVTYRMPDSERNFTLEGVCTAFRKKGIASNIRIKKESKNFTFIKTFFIYSKDIISIEKTGSLKILTKRKNKVKKSKLYFYESLKGKSGKI